jgi:stalled ribosome rescue protein Dom34
MEDLMTTDDILDLFQKDAESLGEIKNTQSDIIMSLAQVIADCKDFITQENYEKLLHIGAVMYQEGLSQYMARSEVDDIMKESSAARKKN